ADRNALSQAERPHREALVEPLEDVAEAVLLRAGAEDQEERIEVLRGGMGHLGVGAERLELQQALDVEAVELLAGPRVESGRPRLRLPVVARFGPEVVGPAAA